MPNHLLLSMTAILACAFFAVLFLQSGTDKIVDRKGNLAWMTPHFEKSPLKGQVAMLVTILTVLELLTGSACAVGAVCLLFDWNRDIARFGLWGAGFTLLCLFAGQRLAKDYVGAASLAGYFAVALLGVASVG